MQVSGVIRKIGWFSLALMWIPLFLGLWNHEERDGGVATFSMIEALGGWFPIAMLLLAFAIFCLSISALSSMLRVRRIVKNGETALAKIVESHSKGKPKSDRVVVDFHLDVCHRKYGSFKTRRVQSVPLLELSSSKAGEIVGVKFEPGSQKAVIIGFAVDPAGAKKAFELAKKGIGSEVDFRNTRRVIKPRQIALVVLFFAAFAGVISYMLLFSFTYSDEYACAIKQLKGHSEIKELIGEPFELGWIATGNTRGWAKTDRSQFQNTSISGSKGKGDLYIETYRLRGFEPSMKLVLTKDSKNTVIYDGVYPCK